MVTKQQVIDSIRTTLAGATSPKIEEAMTIMQNLNETEFANYLTMSGNKPLVTDMTDAKNTLKCALIDGYKKI